MSDKVNVPIESWRPARRGVAGLDPQVVRMGLLAVAVLGAAGLGAGGYALLGHRPHAIPVVEADNHPLRIRPDNPGGNTVAGGEEQIMGGNGHGQVDAMAPAPEAPMPQALRAQIEAARTPPAPPAQPVSLAAPPPPPPATVSDIPDRPASPPPHVAARPPVPGRLPASSVRPVPVASAPLAGAVPPAAGASTPNAGTVAAVGSTPAATGNAQVQLGALESEQAAVAEWQRLTHRMPDLLGSRRPAVLRAEREGKTLWRLRTGGFSDVAAATAFCAQVRSKGTVCAVASF